MQEVIVYRNPMEAAIWNALSNSELTFPIIVSIVCFFAAVMIWESIRRKILPRAIRLKFNGYDSLVVGLIVAAGVVYKMV